MGEEQLPDNSTRENQIRYLKNNGVTWTNAPLMGVERPGDETLERAVDAAEPATLEALSKIAPPQQPNE